MGKEKNNSATEINIMASTNKASLMALESIAGPTETFTLANLRRDHAKDKDFSSWLTEIHMRAFFKATLSMGQANKNMSVDSIFRELLSWAKRLRADYFPKQACFFNKFDRFFYCLSNPMKYHL